MSLKSQPEYTQAAEPQFEQMEPETMTETTTQEPQMDATTIDQQASASVAASTAIAKAATTAVGVPAKFTIAFKDKNNVFDTATVESLSLAIPRITGEQGSAFQNGVELGSRIRLEIISFNHRWVVGTGENDAESKEKFRVSMDNRTISGTGEDFHAYLESLKAEGFSKARISPYLDVFGFVVWTEKKGDIPVDERELSCLQCSQTSMGNFTAFCTTRGLLESKGVAKPIEVIEVTAQKQQNKGGDKYTRFAFSTPKL